jgi:hypothetical protein
MKVYSSKLEKKLEEIEGRLSKNSFETAVLLNQDGNVLFEKIGSSKSVRFSKVDKKAMHGNVLTHNHPFHIDLEIHGYKNTSIFSSTDLLLAYQQKPNEVRMVVGDERHSFQWTTATKQDACDLLTRYESLEVAFKAVNEKITKRLYDGKYKTVGDYYGAYCTMREKYTGRICSFLELNTKVGYIYIRRP